MAWSPGGPLPHPKVQVAVPKGHMPCAEPPEPPANLLGLFLQDEERYGIFLDNVRRIIATNDDPATTVSCSCSHSWPEMQCSVCQPSAPKRAAERAAAQCLLLHAPRCSSGLASYTYIPTAVPQHSGILT